MFALLFYSKGRWLLSVLGFLRDKNHSITRLVYLLTYSFYYVFWGSRKKCNFEHSIHVFFLCRHRKCCCSRRLCGLCPISDDHIHSWVNLDKIYFLKETFPFKIIDTHIPTTHHYTFHTYPPGHTKRLIKLYRLIQLNLI